MIVIECSLGFPVSRKVKLTCILFLINYATAALVEALMGFQFNHVGGGTKTRRPIALHMTYNSACSEPHCFLVNDNGQDTEMSLEELREHIEQENQRLGAESRFQNKDITVKIHYRFCPNLTIVDTPGAHMLPLWLCASRISSGRCIHRPKVSQV